MTDETELQYLDRAEAALRIVLNALTDKLDPDSPTDDPPEKTARAISVVIKSLDDISEKRERSLKRQMAESYTSYEDLPPPSPEEDARFYAEFKRLYNSILDERRTA